MSDYEKEILEIVSRTIVAYKQVLHKLWPLIPMVFLFFVIDASSIGPILIYHRASGVYIGPYVMQLLFCCAAILWLLCPIRAKCQTWWQKALFYLLPEALFVSLSLISYV